MKNRVLKVFGIAVIIVLILMICSSLTSKNDNANNPDVGAVNQIEVKQNEVEQVDEKTIKEIDRIVKETFGNSLIDSFYDEYSEDYEIFIYFEGINYGYPLEVYGTDLVLTQITEDIHNKYNIDCAICVMDSYTWSHIIFSCANGKVLSIVIS